MDALDRRPRTCLPSVARASYPVRPANRVRPLIDGTETFGRICRAIDDARHSVFLTVAFLHPDFRLPGGRGSLFDLLDGASERGLDVRVLFWRANPELGIDERTVFSGREPDRRWLETRGCRLGIRWDRTRVLASCHHQKSWIVDAGHETQRAFVGGMNLNPRSVSRAGHAGERDAIHDVFVEILGPAAADVHHNFVQRWNEASERAEPDGTWGEAGRTDLALPERASAPSGDCTVQIQRTVHPGQYARSSAAPGAEAYCIDQGESAIFEQYQLAIAAAKRTIYIENQALEDAAIVERLHEALERAVRVVALVPARAEGAVRRARSDPAYEPFFRRLAALGAHDRFTMAGIAAPMSGGERTPIYVHSKLMLVDDAFATIGSCNLRARSFLRHTELNASIHSLEFASELRRRLFTEHLGTDVSGLDDLAALDLFTATARANAQRRASGDTGWHGNVFAFSPSAYAT